jgi:hypothetical protein
MNKENEEQINKEVIIERQSGQEVDSKMETEEIDEMKEDTLKIGATLVKEQIASLGEDEKGERGGPEEVQSEDGENDQRLEQEEKVKRDAREEDQGEESLMDLRGKKKLLQRENPNYNTNRLSRWRPLLNRSWVQKARRSEEFEKNPGAGESYNWFFSCFSSRCWQEEDWSRIRIFTLPTSGTFLLQIPERSSCGQGSAIYNLCPKMDWMLTW